MDKIYKFFIYTVIGLIIIIKVASKITEDFAPYPKKEAIDKEIKSRDEPPFNVIQKGEEIDVPEPVTSDEYYKASDAYTLIPLAKRGKWRRPRDTITAPKNCVKYCKDKTGKNYRSYMEMDLGNVGVIKPNIYTHEPSEMLDVYGIDSTMVDTLATPEKLPYTKETRAEWTCQRDWVCFDPNTLLNSHYV